MWIASVKGLVAGVVNLALATLVGDVLPAWPAVAEAMTLGFLAYGISLTLLVISLRHLGTARTGAYFSVAPFFGALLAVVWLGESVDPKLLVAGLLMGIGVWLHLSEQHLHEHVHEPMEHEHEHEHDVHHQHDHASGTAAARHTHPHQHTPMTHRHDHFPDEHHRHTH